ncbi:MAG: hypothetical protein J3K34DRAFT_515981 [Monoraphidium minutum]|nr:MAG: hypothetical protein J3K34DRAFT_515981 [Monoraphidium minutum]
MDPSSLTRRPRPAGARGSGHSAAPRHGASLRHARALVRPRPTVPCRSAREKKDPKRFSSMEEARDYLHSQAERPGPISGLLNWLSGSAFGFGQGFLGGAYKQWLQQQWRAPLLSRGERMAAEDAARRAAAAAAVAERPELVAALCTLLFLPEAQAQALLERDTQLLSVAPPDLAQRLLALKQLLPWCDVAAMVESTPRLLRCDAGFLRSVVRARIELLREGMPGADLATMVQDNPWVLLEDLEAALPRLHDLWPGLEPEAFAASDPAELALALRALTREGPPRREAPWEITNYYTKKLERRTDALGNIIKDPSAIAEPASWTPDARLALAVKVVAGELGAAEAEVGARVELLRAVLPDGGLEGGGGGAKLADMVRLAMDVDGVAARLLALRAAFPRANVSTVAAKNPRLLRMGPEELRACAEEFKRLLLEQGGDDPDALLQARLGSALDPDTPARGGASHFREAPLLLEPGVMAGVLQELSRLFGAGTPPGRLLQGAPGLALSCQSLQGQSRGERDFDYLKDIFSGGAGAVGRAAGGGGGDGGGGGGGGDA